MTISKGSVRIIGGSHRGRRLQFTDQGGDLRPSGDRMRETLFNWLQQYGLYERRVLDLFAGSGVLGAEALSRGADHAVLVEKKRERAADLSRQLTPIFGTRIQVQCADALTWLQRETPAAPFDLVFIDPPYDLGLAGTACAALDAPGWLSEGALVYVESRRHDQAPAAPASWVLEKEKEGGDVRARLYRRP